MGQYSIKELERLSGIKAHTIRIWEKRHQLVAPQRTDTNIRFYSDEDLKKIINVSLLNNHGIKISKIANLSNTELSRKVVELTDSKDEADLFIDQMVVAMIDLEEEAFETLIGKLTVKFGFERMITEIIYPFLEKIGILWQTGNISPAQEHFVSNLIRQKIIVAIDSLPLPDKTAKSVVLFLPENELHEIALLFYHFVTRKEGFRTYYLGQTIPYRDLKSVCERYMPAFIIGSFTTQPEAREVQEFINRLTSDFPKSVVLASGSIVRKTALRFPANFHIFDNTLKLKELLIKK